MNLEKIDVLVQKVEKMLETVRILKSEKIRIEVEMSKLENALFELEQTVAAKDTEIENLKKQFEESDTVICELQETVKNREDEILLAQEKFEQLLNTIETELGTEIPMESSVQENSSQETISETPSSDEEGAQPTFFD